MAHSVELLLDVDADRTVRDRWDALTDAGIRSQAAHRGPSNRPHVTVAVAAAISDAVDAELATAAAAMLPLRCRIGAPVLFGHDPFVLARLVVASTELLELQARIHRICLPHMTSGPFPHTCPGSWTPHVTLARRLRAAQLERALPLAGDDLDATFVRLRRWDGDTKTEYALS